MQKGVTAVNQLPRTELQRAVEAATPQLRSSYTGLREAACATLETLMDLQGALIAANPKLATPTKRACRSWASCQNYS